MTENYPTLTDAILQHIQQIVMSRREGYGLPRTFYHDNTLYEHELERVWLSGWVFAGHTCQIPRQAHHKSLERLKSSLNLLDCSSVQYQEAGHKHSGLLSSILEPM